MFTFPSRVRKRNIELTGQSNIPACSEQDGKLEMKEKLVGDLTTYDMCVPNWNHFFIVNDEKRKQKYNSD